MVLNETVVNARVKEITDEGKAMFIQFYSPECNYCKALSKDWIALAELDIPNIQLAVVNCIDEEILCRYWDISEVPSIYMLKDRILYIYNGDRLVEDMKEFITGDYERSPRRELPRSLDYKAFRHAQEKKKDLIKEDELIDLKVFVPNMSSPTFMIGSAALITVIFLAFGYCCAPSVEEEETNGSEQKETPKAPKGEENKETKKANKSKETEPDTEKIKSTKTSKNARKRNKASKE
eukprot:CAMPEP_0117049906 /NCGR_PEP_ID=MMETSP0472-20121206/34456_1 /TAXON_ID=693140 ORGANISM="Tiarina fusus, Strain LIS" /NCGR_SAMPLE_ID=MMETSP0472 /ASSEMBLY_ACC=CAM_ASM_000603 /LENGTH=235 /DNA_ID=CAMNT_0004763483 /DNA_START=124 /DNA_END=831 /DNA_ORIENTATION=+